MKRHASIALSLLAACSPAAVANDAAPSPDAAIAVDAASFDASPRADGGTDGGIPSVDAGRVSYTTTFDGTEAPISEGGHWAHHATQWAEVDTNGDVAYGTQPGDGAYTDSYALLSGLDFGPDQTASVVIHRASGLAPGGTREVEILLRASDDASGVHLYECNLAFDGGYAEVVRWNGALGDYTYVSAQGSGGPGAVHDGDVFRAEIVGHTIRTWLGDRMLQQVDVSAIGGTVYTDGQPGIAFWRGSGASATPGDYGFTSFTANDLP